MKLEFSHQLLGKHSNIRYHKNPSSGSRIVLCGRTARRTNMSNLLVAFRSFAKAPISTIIRRELYVRDGEY